MQEKKSFKTFTVIWAGQFFSMLGSSLTSFCLSLWLFENTKNVTSFTLSLFCSIFPFVIFGPIGGSFADRKNRKKIIMLADSFDALVKLAMVILLFLNKFSFWMIYIINFLTNLTGAFQGPAFSSSIAMLVEKDKLSKANGMGEISSSASSILSPVIGGALYPFIGLKGVIIIDFVTYFIGISTVAFSKIPQPELQNGESSKIDSPFVFIKDIKLVFEQINRIPGLKNIIIFAALSNFIGALTEALNTPYILGFNSAQEYGIYESILGITALGAGFIITMLPDIKDKYKAIYIILTLVGIISAMEGFFTRWYFFIIFVALSSSLCKYSSALFLSTVQAEIEPSLLGRCFSVIGSILNLLMPVAFLISGPLTDLLFTPILAENGILHNTTVNKFFANGIALEFFASGILLAIISFLGFISHKKSVRKIEDIPNVAEMNA